MKSVSVSRLHSVLLVAAGVVVGSLGTLALQNLLAPERDATAAPGTAPGKTAETKRRAADARVRLEQILAADDREHKSNDLQRLGREASAEDEAAALKLAAGIKGNEDRLEFTKGVISQMAGRDPKAAAEYALQNFQKGALQGESLRVALGVWGASNPREAYAWAHENLTGPVKEEAIHSLVTSWASRSPDAAARWFEETGSTSQPLLGAVLSGWVKSPGQAPAAARWVEGLKGDNLTAGRSLVAGEWARQDPVAAAANYPEPAPELADVLANAWAASDPTATAKWVLKLPEGPGREQAAATLASVWAASDVEGAIAWSAGLSDPALRGAAVEHLATTWGAIDPDQALAWLSTQPPALRDRAYAGAYNSWAGTDEPGLADWITRLPAGTEADIARRSLAEVRLANDAAAALDLTLGMTTAAQPDATGRFFRTWRRTDDAAAQEWLQTNWNALSAATQARLAQEQER